MASIAVFLALMLTINHIVNQLSMRLNVIIAIKYLKVASRVNQRYDAIVLGSAKIWRIEKIVIMREHLPSGTFLIAAIAVAGIKSRQSWKFITKIAIVKTTSSRTWNYFVLLITLWIIFLLRMESGQKVKQALSQLSYSPTKLNYASSSNH